MSGLKLLSWNMNQKASNWQTVLDSGVDAAMLQEAKTSPVEMAGKLLVKEEVELEVSDLPWRAIVAGLTNNEKYDFTPIRTQPLGGSDPESLMVSRLGTLDAAVLRINGVRAKNVK